MNVIFISRNLKSTQGVILMLRLIDYSRINRISNKLKYFSTKVSVPPKKTEKSYAGSTIFALSSGYGKCGVAVIRISGPKSNEVLKQVGGFKIIPEPRKALLRKLRDPASKEILDHGLVLWFPGPKSFTGEDSCELQIHGGPAVISAVLNTLSNMKDFRPAEAGEFTKRAFYAGKLNLTEVEGLGDLIHSETELQRKQALIQMEGALGELYSKWRNSLLECVAHIEAYIDFSEDQHLDDDILDKTQEKILLLQNDIQKHLKDGRRGERLRDGVMTVILGAPNVGKSSLMNTLCQQKTAIVSPIPGTTRDVIKSTIDISGFPVILADTAGLRVSTTDIIEEEGISCAKNYASKSDLIVLVLDTYDFASWCTKNYKTLSDGFLDYLMLHVETLKIEQYLYSCDNIKEYMKDINEVKSQEMTRNAKCLIVFNKVDLLSNLEELSKVIQVYGSLVTFISCKTGYGMDSFLTQMGGILKVLCGDPSREHPNYSQARHRHYLTACASSLNKCLSYSEVEVDLAAHELRSAISSLGKITGHISTEEILDVIFKEFCIGK